MEKVAQNFELLLYVICIHRATPNKQSPNTRKVAESGHPVSQSASGLPDGLGIFKSKIPIWENFRGPWNGKVGIGSLWPFEIYYDHLVHFLANWKFSGNLVYFPPFWYTVSRKIWQPLSA
jgi:hypothetical protein